MTCARVENVSIKIQRVVYLKVTKRQTLVVLHIAYSPAVLGEPQRYATAFRRSESPLTPLYL
jgi:hypothetical protein